MSHAPRRIIAIACGILASTTALHATTYTWTGAGDGTNFGNSQNWSPIGLPNGSTQDIAQWDGVTTSNLVISLGATSPPGSGFGGLGISLVLTKNQNNSVQIIASVSSSGALGLFNVTNNSPNSPLILGDNTANLLTIVTRPAGAVHEFVNNSPVAAVLNGSTVWQAGGGNAYTLEFAGTGDWTVNTPLQPDNSGPASITVDGPGSVTWTKTGHAGFSGIGFVTVNGGRLVLKSIGLIPQSASQAISNNGTLVFDVSASADTIARVISGFGSLQVTNGTLTLNRSNTYTGDTVLTGGELVPGAAENPGTSGPLGVGGSIMFSGGALGFGVNNVFDYSGRFSSAAGQAYRFDTGGQNVIFTNAAGLTSSGGTLTKIGPGTLTLAATSSYSGQTTVAAGNLVFQGAKIGSGDIALDDGATLGVTATAPQITPETLTLGTALGATLEFNALDSTTVPPVAADVLASSGTLTININSGSFNPGQSYPLLAWTSGHAPAVSPGMVSGALGNLSTNGNTIQFNVTSVPLVWTGTNSAYWTDPDNWTQTGIPISYFDPSPVIFDDTATGTTAVIVDAPVHPTAVTVNNSIKTYTIASSSGNNIGGSTGLTKNGSGQLTLSGGANTYTGTTILNGGTVSVSVLANGGSPSDIGAAANSVLNLVLNGGTLQYTGTGASIDRLFTLSTAGGAIDGSGAGPLTLNNTGEFGDTGNGPRTLTLKGSAVGNTFAPVLADYGGATALTISGTGKWILTGNNVNSGVTTINGGVLQIGAGGANGSLGTGNIVDNGGLDFNRAGTLVVSGAISGAGSVTNDGAGTVILVGGNTYTGGTVINAGTVQLGNGGATGGLDGGSPVIDNATLIFNLTSPFTLGGYGGFISGTGNVLVQGAGLVKCIGNNTYTGWTTISPGATFQPCDGNQGQLLSSVVTNNGTLKLARQDTGVFSYANPIGGFGRLWMDIDNSNAGDVTLLGTNTYTGGTFIAGGSVILGDGVTPGAGSIIGNVVFTNSAAFDTPRKLEFNRPDNLTFSGNIIGAETNTGIPANLGSVVQNGSGTLTLTGSNTYKGSTTVSNGGSLFINGANKAASTAIASGTLGGIGTLTGPVTLNEGTTLAPGPAIGAVGTLTISNDLTLAGDLAIDIDKSLVLSNDLVVVTGALSNDGTGTVTVTNHGPALVVGDKFTLFSEPVQNGAALTLTGSGVVWANHLSVDGSISVASIGLPTLNFAPTGNGLQFTWTGGFKLQAQTNTFGAGLGTNWSDYPGGGTSGIVVPVGVTNGSVFFRLVTAP